MIYSATKETTGGDKNAVCYGLSQCKRKRKSTTWRMRLKESRRRKLNTGICT